MIKNKVFDGLLVLQHNAGDKKALGILVKRYNSKFCRHAYCYVKDVDKSKDIAQESWRAVLKSLSSLKDVNSFGSWALRIVTRKSLDYLKRNQWEMERNREYFLQLDVDDSSKSNKEIYLNKLKKAIVKLPENQQVILRLFYTQQYSLKEISTILEISEGTVKSRLFHAREKLKSIIKT